MKKLLLVLLCAPLLQAAALPYRSSTPDPVNTSSFINKQTVEKVVSGLTAQFPAMNAVLIRKGVSQCAALWTEADGTNEQFETFCNTYYVGTADDRQALFLRISANLESLLGNYNQISIDLKSALHIDKGEIIPLDELFGGYEPSAHMVDDFFENKIAFVTILNFPFYSLSEKSSQGTSWSRLQWAYARLGDLFISRVPATLLLKAGEAASNSDTYISGYNICMDKLIDQSGKTHFAPGMKLISHWGLRDELKANYDGSKEGLLKQKMIYDVMKHIILQDIPSEVINSNEYTWDPAANKLLSNGKEVAFVKESDRRYAHLLNNFHALKNLDPYNPAYPTVIQRKFDQEMEIPQEVVEKLFIEFISSPQVKQVAGLISKRLGRKLLPFDIWYDGFKPRAGISQEDLNSATRAKYPNRDAVEKDLPNILVKLGFSRERADYICKHITVDPSRGAGHAWGALMKSDVAHLRTRIQSDGMDYKGYNIAVHEFGHNVEQTISLFEVDYYLLNGVPSTAFTEALAFIFQKRDLELLGFPNVDPDKEHLLALDNFWACYEIMGVSIVDMRVWKWLYEHPQATPAELRNAVVRIATEVWNLYYADVFGIPDQPILGIYSHMIDAPLYLSAYPVGHLIDFQIEGQLKGNQFADEVWRIYKTGRLIPELWMKEAVGSGISIKPMIEATDAALKAVSKK